MSCRGGDVACGHIDVPPCTSACLARAPASVGFWRRECKSYWWEGARLRYRIRQLLLSLRVGYSPAYLPHYYRIWQLHLPRHRYVLWHLAFSHLGLLSSVQLYVFYVGIGGTYIFTNFAVSHT